MLAYKQLSVAGQSGITVHCHWRPPETHWGAPPYPHVTHPIYYGARPFGPPSSYLRIGV